MEKQIKTPLLENSRASRNEQLPRATDNSFNYNSEVLDSKQSFADDDDDDSQRNTKRGKTAHGGGKNALKDSQMFRSSKGVVKNINCGQSDCGFLQEAKSCVDIKNMDEEIKFYQEEGILSDPKEIYLNHCRDYTQQYLAKDKMEIKNYQFGQKDFLNRVLTTKIIDLIKIQEKDIKSKIPLDDKEIAEKFKSLNMKLFTDIMFHNDRQILLVKSWEKINMKSKITKTNTAISLRKMMRNQIKNSALGSAFENEANEESQLQIIGSQNKGEDITFYIKTIQFIDPQNCTKSEPILVEQVFGEVDDFRLYDTTVLNFENKVYFFKRLFGSGDLEKIEKALDPKQTRTTDKKYEPCLGKEVNGINSELQLFSYDLDSLLKKKDEIEEKITDDKNKFTTIQSNEEPVEGYLIDENHEEQLEYNELNELVYDPCQEKRTYSEEEVKRGGRHNTEDGITKLMKTEFPKQYNIVFSKPFGPIAGFQTSIEEQFLKMQYFSKQEYGKKKKDDRPFKIYKIEPLPFPPQFAEIFDSSQFILNISKNLNRQVQVLNHHQKLDIIRNKAFDDLRFVIQNMFQMIEIIYKEKPAENTKDKNKEQEEQTKIIEYPRQSTDLFQKIWNINGIQIQDVSLMNLEYSKKEEEREKPGSKKNEETDLSQFFFIDSRNKIQLLYPNFKSQVDRTKRVDMIQRQTGIKKNVHFNKYKKISCFIQKNPQKKEQEIYNTFQDFDHLKKILNNQEVTVAHQFIFGEDNSKNQILYITNIKSNEIIMLTMQETQCEICSIVGNKSNKVDKRTKRSQFILQSKQQNSIPQLLRQKTCNQKQQNALMNTSKVESGNDMNKQDCDLCEEDHDEAYMSYQKFATDVDVEPETIRLSEKDRVNHVYLPNFRNDDRIQVKTFEQEGLPKTPFPQSTRLVFYQPTQKHVLFIFTVFNQETNTNDNNENFLGNGKITKRSHIFVRKTKQECESIFESGGILPILKHNDRVLIMKQHDCWEYILFRDIYAYQQGLATTELFPDENEDEQFDTSTNRNRNVPVPYQDIKLSLSKVTDEQTMIHFVPFIYQESAEKGQNLMLIYDIVGNRTCSPISLNPSLKTKPYLYTDSTLFNCFSICRVSDVYQEGDIQRVKYQLFTIYTEKLGMFSSTEFLITYSSKNVNVQSIGYKYILLSQKVIQQYDWIFIKNSSAIPYYDSCGSVKGCQLVFQLDESTYSMIDLKDQDQNNIYKYKSDVALCGKKKFYLMQDNKENKEGRMVDDEYIIVSSVILRRNFIEMDIFDPGEAYSVLTQSQLLQLGMRTPDLKFLSLNNFESVQKQDMFRTQELLLGKSIMDICLSDAQAIEEALHHTDFESDNLEGSVIHQVTADDKVRLAAFKETEIYPRIMMLQMDLNFRSTIERGLSQNMYKSMKALIEFFYQEIDSMHYYHIMMKELELVIANEQLDINEFFQITDPNKELKSESKEFCNIECPLNDPSLPIFSAVPAQYKRITAPFENFHDYQNSLVSEMKEVLGSSSSQEHILKHKYVNFQALSISVKIKKVVSGDIKSKDELDPFDDLYYAQLLNTVDKGNVQFYLQESVQRIIDFQWESTRIYMQRMFYIYLFVYLIPISVLVFTDNDEIHKWSLNIATLPACLLFFGEFVQMYYSDPLVDYFVGWNIIDFLLFVAFVALRIVKVCGIEDDGIYIPELQIFLLSLCFTKMGFFIRIFETYGFLIQMISYCIQGLIPFIITFMVFNIIFTICYVILNMEIDEEVNDAEGVGYLFKTLLQTFRTSIGELGVPSYEKVWSDPPNFYRSLNIASIWVFWFSQTFFMLVIIMNFLIGVITATYERTVNLQKIISYQHKADLNEEYYQLISFVSKLRLIDELPEYKYVIFSTSRSASTLEDNEHVEVAEDIAKYINRDAKQIRKKYSELEEQAQNHTRSLENFGGIMLEQFDLLMKNHASVESMVKDEYGQYSEEIRSQISQSNLRMLQSAQGSKI